MTIDSCENAHRARAALAVAQLGQIMRLRYTHRSVSTGYALTIHMTLENGAVYMQHRHLGNHDIKRNHRPMSYIRHIYRQMRWAITNSSIIALESPCRS